MAKNKSTNSSSRYSCQNKIRLAWENSIPKTHFEGKDALGDLEDTDVLQKTGTKVHGEPATLLNQERHATDIDTKNKDNHLSIQI